MSDNHEEPESKYICVAAGPNIGDGQVAIYEVHPDHPYVLSSRGDGSGEHQVTVSKGVKGESVAWAGRTSEVQRALGRGYLREVKAPSDLPEPIDGPPTESSQRVANNQPQIDNPEVMGFQVYTQDQVDEIQRQLDAAKTELEAAQKREEDRLAAEAEAKKAADAEAKKAADAEAKAGADAAKATGNQSNRNS